MNPFGLHRGGAAALLLAAACGAAAAADPRGRFLTASGNLEVDVADCGSALCGTVTRVIANHSMSRPGQAMEATDATPALGMQILRGFKPEGEAASTATDWNGQIYNRENGKTYDCTMALDASGNLVLRAYVLAPLFGRTQVWQRQAPPTAAPASGEAEGSRR